MAHTTYFLGANSKDGFYSLMDRLIDPAEARAIYILKGGPGCGKSSLMKKVGQAAQDAGCCPQYIYCSGDPDSLDGLVIDEWGVALCDGTAPHIAEPSYPGAVERYVNLGACYDTAGLATHKKEIMELMGGYQGAYRRAYRCLKGAGQLIEDNLELLETDALKAKIKKRAKGIIAREIPKHGTGGKVTERFLSALTCKGQVCLFETANELCKYIYELADSYGLAHLLLEELLGAAVERGHDAVVCPDPMAPSRLQHLLLPGLGVAFVTGSPELPYPGKPYRRIRLDAMADQEELRRHKARIRFSRKVARALLDEGMETLAAEKELHDALEKVYNPYVDFDRVYAMADEVIGEILELAAKL